MKGQYSIGGPATALDSLNGVVLNSVLHAKRPLHGSKSGFNPSSEKLKNLREPPTGAWDKQKKMALVYVGLDVDIWDHSTEEPAPPPVPAADLLEGAGLSLSAMLLSRPGILKVGEEKKGNRVQICTCSRLRCLKMNGGFAKQSKPSLASFLLANSINPPRTGVSRQNALCLSLAELLCGKG